MDNTLICYMSLGAAVVEQAARDYRSFPNDVRHFFCDPSGLFDVYMPKSDGEAVYNQIKRNYETIGSWKVPEYKRIRNDIFEDEGIDIDDFNDDWNDEEDFDVEFEKEILAMM